MRQLVVLLSLTACLALCAGCDTGGSAQEEKELEVRVTADSITLGGEGDTTTVQARVVDASTGNVVQDASIEWSSEDQSVATVSDEGLVRAQSEGETQIKASNDGDTERVFTEVIEINATSKNTGNDGEVEKNGDIFRFVDASTEDPITDLTVSFLESKDRTVFVARDEQSSYPTVIKSLNEKKGYKKLKTSSNILITTLITKFTLIDPIRAIKKGELPAGTLRWVVRNFYECNTGTILEVSNNVEDFGTWPESADKAVISFSFEGLANLAEIAGTSSVSIASTVLSIRDIGSVLKNRAKIWYFSRGYEPSSKFKYCKPNGLAASQVFGDDMIIIPKKKPPQEATEKGSLEGEIRDKETGEPLAGTIELAGPSPRGVSVEDGSFRFGDLIFGEYTLTAASTGHESKTVQVTIDGDVSGNIRLSKFSGGGSPPNQIIAFSSTRDGNEEVYRMRGDGNDRVRLTDDPAADRGAAISPAGDRVAFLSKRTGEWELFSVGTDGQNLKQITSDLPARQAATRGLDWRPDGEKIVVSIKNNDLIKLYEVDVDGSEDTRQLTGGDLDAAHPEYSPDGSRLAMSRNTPFAGGTSEIYISDADGDNMEKLTDADDPAEPTFVGASSDLKLVHSRQPGDSGDRKIWKMNTDGSEEVELSNNDANERRPVGPAGPGREKMQDQFIFLSDRGGEDSLWRMDVDGSSAEKIATVDASKGLDWWVGN